MVVVAATEKYDMEKYFYKISAEVSYINTSSDSSKGFDKKTVDRWRERNAQVAILPSEA